MCFQTTLTYVRGGTGYAGVGVNEKGMGRLALENRNNIRLEKTSEGVKANFLLSFNYNRVLFEYYCKEFNVKKLESDFLTKDNVLPSKIRSLFLEKGISISACRKISTKYLCEEVLAVERDLENVTGLNDWQKSFSHLSINYDLLTQPSLNLCSEEWFLKNLQDQCSETSQGRFADSYPNRHLRIKSLQYENGDKKDQVTGYCYDSSKISCYFKESSKYGAVNRLERNFLNSKQIRKIAGQSRFNDQGTLTKIIHSLAMEVFDTYLPVFDGPCPYTNDEKLKLVKEYCRIFFKSNWELAYECLTGSSQCICTGKASLSHKKLFPVTRTIGQQDKFLMKKKNSRATYVINWNWVLKKKSFSEISLASLSTTKGEP